MLYFPKSTFDEKKNSTFVYLSRKYLYPKISELPFNSLLFSSAFHSTTVTESDISRSFGRSENWKRPSRTEVKEKEINYGFCYHKKISKEENQNKNNNKPRADGAA